MTECELLFEETVFKVLRELAACGERLSNEAEAKAFDVLEKAFRAAGAETYRETVPIFVSTSEAIVGTADRTFASPCVEGNAMTHPLCGGAPGDFAVNARGPLRRLDEAERCALLAGTLEGVRGAVLLTHGLASLALLRAAQAAGAAGVLFQTGDRVRRMIVSDVWGSPATAEDLERYAALPNASVDETVLVDVPDGEVVLLENRIHSGWIPSTVLTAATGCPADIEDASDRRPRVIMTGHMDSWGAGAVDNASGLAVMTGILEALAREKHPLKAGVMAVVWSGHSHGRYAGSAAWSERHAAALERSVFLNINVDCLGMRDSVVTGRMPVMACAERLARQALTEAGIRAELRPERFTRSCDQSFLGIGIPTIFSNVAEVPPQTGGISLAVAGLGGVYGPHWHTRSDDLDAVDPRSLMRDGGIFLAAARLAARRGLDVLSLTTEAERCAEELRTSLEEARTLLDRARTLPLTAPNRQALCAFAASPVWSALKGYADRPACGESPDEGGDDERIRRLHAMIRSGCAEDELGFGRAGDRIRSRLCAACERFRKLLDSIESSRNEASPERTGMELLCAVNRLHREAGLLARTLSRSPEH